MIDNQFEIIYSFFADVKNDKPMEAHAHAHSYANKSDSSTEKRQFVPFHFISVFI